jgi:hypothetical protein
MAPVFFAILGDRSHSGLVMLERKSGRVLASSIDLASQEIWISVQRWDYHVSGRYSHEVDFMFEGQVEGGTLAGIPVAATVQAVEGHDPRNTEVDSSTLTLLRASDIS